MTPPANLLAGPPTALPAELTEVLAAGAGVRVERIVSHGHASPDGFRYDQTEHEWVAVLAGAARVRFEDGVADMGLGDHLLIPAGRRHRVEWTTPDGPTLWLSVFYPAGP